MAKTPTLRGDARGVAHGYRSGLEDKVAKQIHSAGHSVMYEQVRLSYVKPSKPSTYRPDFILHNGIIVETKGRFLSDDRQKHKFLKEQWPTLDIRFVFSNSKQRLTKVSPTTYAKWCHQHSFTYADHLIPTEWFDEPVSKERWDAIKKATAS